MQAKFEQVPTQQNSSFISYIRNAEHYPFEMHYHPQYELVYIIQGQGRIHAFNTIRSYQNGDMVLLGPNLMHTFVSEKGKNQALVIQFPHDILGDQAWNNNDMASVKELLYNSKIGILYRNKVKDKIKTKLYAINDSVGFDRLVNLLEVLYSLSSLNHIDLLTPSETLILPKQSTHLLKIINYVNRNYTDNINLKTASSYLGMSQSGFIKFFKRNFGCNFYDYLINLRIDFACEKLIGTNDKILDICYQSGFNNLSNFNRQFKKRKQISPRQYRVLFSGEKNSIRQIM